MADAKEPSSRERGANRPEDAGEPTPAPPRDHHPDPARDRAEPLDPDRPTPGLLLRAYAAGIFPMADPDLDEIAWFSPEPRAILPLDAFHVPRSLARRIEAGVFNVRADVDFEAVIRACGPDRGSREPTWIDERLITAYVGLHELGHAHSIEAWREDLLVGGLYGVTLGGAFFGESMFVRPELGGTDASKVCLVRLVEHLRERGFSLLDTQFRTGHLDRFGCVEIPRAEYMRRLARAIDLPATWGRFAACR